MSFVPRKTIDIFQKLVEGGWEPSFDDVKEKFFSTAKNSSSLTRTSISRLRRRFKKQNPPQYFYCIGEEVDDDGNTHILGVGRNKGIYKLLQASGEYSQITNMLWKITDGFRKSCSQVLDDGINKYPKTMQPLLIEFKAGMHILSSMAGNMTHELDSAIKSLNIGGKNERSNK